MNEFVEQFLLESRELVAQATDDLLALEEQPGNQERLDSAFRAFHTLKGAAAIVEFAAMGRTLHAAEDILAAVRSSEGAIAPIVLDECLACLDVTSRWLDAMQANGEVPKAAEIEADRMIARLVASSSESESDGAPARRGDRWLETLREAAGKHPGEPRTGLRYVPDAEAFFHGEDPLAMVAVLPHLLELKLALTDSSVSLETMSSFTCGLEIVALLGSPTAEVRAALKGVSGTVEILDLKLPSPIQTEPDSQAMAVSLLQAQVLVLQDGEIDGLTGRLASAGRTAANALMHLGRSEAADVVERATAKAQDGRTAAPLIAAITQALAAGSTEPRGERDTFAQVQAPRSLRVDMNKIDALVKLAGELIVLKNAIGHAARLSHESKEVTGLTAMLREQHALFDRLTAELQSAVLSIRVLPLRSVFRRFPKLVREVAGKVGRSVRLVTEGEATEADATIVDALFEPLLHTVRNAVDHGIENPAGRAAAGKPAMGTVVLRARRDTDKVVIEVEDDGGGIDVARVRAVAAQREIVKSEALAAMTDAEAADLIFAPGFSTATTVTDLSGRGVGMDSVRAAVDRLGGRVTLSTRPGTGTTVSLVLPFSLMMTRVMTVEVAGQAFGLPIDAILEATTVDRDRVASIGSGKVFVLRNQTIPVVALADMLGLSSTASDPNTMKVVVISVGTQLAGLEVDRLGERMDVMLKPMDGLLADMRGVVGTTLLGDGRVLIVLDALEMLR